MNHDPLHTRPFPDSGAGKTDVPGRNRSRPRERNATLLSRRKTFLWICFVFFFFLLVTRIINILGISPEYDEIWTVQHYTDIPVLTVFTDVAAPNNHVLNSLGIRFFLSALPFCDQKLAMRMTALLGFCGLFLLLLRATFLLLKNNPARGAVLAVALLNGMILHYAETARGYSLQSFFVFGLFFSLLCFHSRPPEDRVFHAGMWLLCAVGACLSVSSGVLQVTVLTGLWGILYVPFRAGAGKIRREFRPMILAGILFSFFVLAWYGGNYSRFAEGQAMFGETFQTPAQFLSYCFRVLRDTGLIWTLPCLAACGFLLRGRPQWRLCALTGGAVVLMLVSALFTKGGPARTYLPLFVPTVFSVGAALDVFLTERKGLERIAPWLLLGLVAVCAFFSDKDRKKAADPDMAILFDAVTKQDPNVFVSYRYTDQYVLRVLFGDAAAAEDQKRQSAPEMLLLLNGNAISTIHAGNPFDEIPVPPGAAPVATDYFVPQEDVRFWLYRLHPVRPGETLNGKTVLCFSTVLVPDSIKLWLADNFGFVNSMFYNRQKAENPHREHPRICYAAVGNGLDPDVLLKLEQSNPGSLLFRVVSD